MPQTEFCFENEWLYIHFYPYKNPYIHFFQYFEVMAFPQNLEKNHLKNIYLSLVGMTKKHDRMLYSTTERYYNRIVFIDYLIKSFS